MGSRRRTPNEVAFVGAVVRLDQDHDAWSQGRSCDGQGFNVASKVNRTAANQITVAGHDDDIAPTGTSGSAKAGMAAAERIHAEIFARPGVSEERHSEAPWAGAHIMGTYRMGTDPRTSVVDPELRTHDHSNLFLLGSGAYPTGAAANPTLTIAALSLRAVDSIAQTLVE